jgi:uncharacterized protein
MKTLDFGLEIKSLDEAGVLEGFASTYGNVDRVGDIVMPGAFTKTLRDTGGKVPILWQHDQREPIGLANLSDEAGGLRLKGKLDLDVDIGRRAYSALRKRIVGGLSIGYETARSTMKGGVRQLLEIKLFEVSIVTIPANAEAVVTSVKDADSAVAGSVRAMNEQIAALAAEAGMRAITMQVLGLARQFARDRR